MDSRKPLTAAEIEMDEICTLIHHETPSHCCGCYIIQYGNGVGLRALCNECGHSVDLIPLLTPPPDAAVREAVKAAERYAMPNIAFQELISTPHLSSKHLSTLLRAVQAPRLTGEQVGRLREAADTLEAHGEVLEAQWTRAAFPEAFAGEVGK